MIRRVLGLAAALAVLAGCGPAPGPTAPPPARVSAPGPCGGPVPGGSHRQARVGPARLHYVIAGRGPPVVLLHGFPETWYAWRGVMPALAARHTVIAPDLRGIGCSSLGPARYDAQTMAADVHRLMQSLDIPRAAVVGHDLGGMVAFAYARTYRQETSHLVVSGALLPGFGLQRLLEPARRGRGPAPHLAWFQHPDVPERAIVGRERAFLARFINSPSVVQSPAFESYLHAYARPGRFTAALGQYRALAQDAADNRRGLGNPLRMPVLALGGHDGVRATADSLQQVASHVSTAGIPDASHYAHDERPAAFAAALDDFLART